MTGLYCRRLHSIQLIQLRIIKSSLMRQLRLRCSKIRCGWFKGGDEAGGESAEGVGGGITLYINIINLPKLLFFCKIKNLFLNQLSQHFLQNFINSFVAKSIFKMAILDSKKKMYQNSLLTEWDFWLISGHEIPFLPGASLF